MDTAQNRIDNAPLPDAREIRRRSSLPRQLGRFLALNWSMFRLAKRRH